MTRLQNNNHRRPFMFHGSTLLIVLCLMLVAALWSYRTPLINRYGTGYLEKILSRTIGATVTINHLDLSFKHLIINGLFITDEKIYELNIPTLSVQFSLNELLAGKVEGLQLLRPQLRLNLPDVSATPTQEEFTRKLPALQINLVEILDAQIDLHREHWHLPIRSLNYRMEKAPFGTADLKLKIGEDPTLILTATGQTHADPAPELRLTSLTIDDTPLLTSPLRLSLVNQGSIGGTINLDHLNHAQLSNWLDIIGLDNPLPPNSAFAVSELQADITLTAHELQIRLQAAEVQIEYGGTAISLHHLNLALSRPRHHWRLTGTLILAPTTAVKIEVLTDGHSISVATQGQMPEIARLPHIWGEDSTAPVNGNLNWTINAVWEAGVIDLEGTTSLSQATLKIGDIMSRPLEVQSSFRVDGPMADLSGAVELAVADTPLLSINGNLRQQTITLHRTEIATLSNLLVDSTLWPTLIEPLGWIGATLLLSETEGARHGYVDMHGDLLRVSDLNIRELHFYSPFRLQQHLELTETTASFNVDGATLSVPRVQIGSSIIVTPSQVDIDISSVELVDIDYLAAAGMSAVAGAQITAAGTLSLDMDQQLLHGRLSGSLLIQEALYNALYADLSGLPVNWDITGNWHLESGLVEAHQLRLILADIGELNGSGQWGDEQITANIDLELFDLADGLTRQLRPILPLQYARLQELDISGTLSASLKTTIDGKQRQFEGLIRPRAVTLIDPTTQLQLLDFEGEIPLLFTTGVESLPARQGQAHFSQLTVGPGRITSSPLVFSSTPNRLRIVDTLEISIGGGHIRIDDLDIGFSPDDYSLGGHVRIDDINLAQLTNDLGLTPLQGQLSADLGTVTYRNGHLRSDGDMLINIFAGEMWIRNLSAGDIFSSYRSFSADIDLAGIDLGQMTTTFEFGEINGTLDGYIHNLRLFGTIPSAFVAEVRTREQGQRNISVRAIDNLSVISQGGLSAALSRGVYQFIDFYRYRKIGIFCTLHNDVLIIKGTARRDSDLYLVDGGLIPPRIDILAPQTAISFREMLRRLRRIDRSGPF